MWRVVVARTDDNSTLLSSEISSGPVGPSHLSALSGAPASHHYYPGYPPPPPPPPPPHHATYQPQHTDMRHHEMRPDLRPELRHDMHRPDLRHPQQQDMHQRQDMGQRNEMRHDMTQQQQQQQQHQEMSMRQTNHELTELRPSHELPELKIDGPELRTRDTQNQGHQRNLKRPMSDSDCDDVFSEESGKEPCSSPGGDSCQHASRKRRRGMIEKKRRDRINASLSELRRLVPAAARDPHSGKLEKAEILQLTVEHLRSLRNKGPDGYDSTKLAMDYHAVGWSECASEVGRYLTTMEGLDERDPLRLRVMSHLQSFHREHPSSNSTALPPSASLTSSSTATSYDIPSVSGAMPPGSIPSIGGSGSGSGGGGGGGGFGWGQYPGQYPQQQHGKPYRPWGAELAY